MSNIKEKRWKPRLPVLVDLLTGSMATKLRFLIVVPTRPRATPLPLMTKKTAIHGFLSVRCSAWQPIASLSFKMNEAMSMIIFYEREDPALVMS